MNALNFQVYLKTGAVVVSVPSLYVINGHLFWDILKTEIITSKSL